MKQLIPISILLFLPVFSEACTVCFGGVDSDLSRGFFWGILFLLLLPFVLIGGFVGTIAYHLKKRNDKN